MATDRHTDSELPSLPVLNSKRFPHPVKFPFTAYLDAHDLLAIVTSIWTVSVFRITSGQTAYTIKHGDTTAEVTALSWKPDGSCLGVAWSTGQYGIYDGGNGKQLHLVEEDSAMDNGGITNWRLALTDPSEEDIKSGKVRVPEEVKHETPQADPIGVGVLGWMGHEVHSTRMREKNSGMTTEEWYEGIDDEEVIEGSSKRLPASALTELPRAITTLDTTKILPRLSAIPSHNNIKGRPDPNMFSSQASTDGIFLTPSDSTSDSVQSLLVCQDNGSVQVLLDETVKIASRRVEGRAFMHTATPRCPSHAMVSETEDGRRILNIVDLPLQTLGGPLLHVIATNTKRMQTLLEYVVQTLKCVEHDYKTNSMVPHKWLSSLEDDLKTHQAGDIVSNFFHLAMTGTISSASLFEWITDIVKDTGWKRWEVFMATMYTNLQNHLFINLLPALDRFSIAVTTLRGLAIFHEGTSKFDCPPHLFSNILDKIDSLRLTAQKMLLVVQTESRQARAFLKWLKVQVDIAAAQPFSASALETEQREMPNLDFSLILPYIKDSLRLSMLDKHIMSRPGMEWETTKEKFFDNKIIASMSYERTKSVIAQLNQLEPGSEVKSKEVEDPTALINLPAIACTLMGHVRIALQQITEWQSRMLPSPQSIPLDLDREMDIVDMVMVPSSPAEASYNLKLLAIHPSQPTRIYILEYSSSSKTVQGFQHALPPSTSEILDVKFIRHEQTTSLLTLSKDVSGDTILTRHHSSEQSILHVFLAGINFKPCKLTIGGRRGRGICVVLGNKGKEWRVLDLDSTVGGAKEDGMNLDLDEYDDFE